MRLRLLVVLLWVSLFVLATSATVAQDAVETPETVTEEIQVEETEAEFQEAVQLTPEPFIPDEVARFADDWPLPNKDYRNTRAVLNSDIHSGTVDRLYEAWTFPIPGRSNYGAAASNPIILGDVVYFQDLASNTFAIELDDGEVVWEQMFDNTVVGPNGPAVGYGLVFINAAVDEFAALDMETGEVVWSRGTLDRPTGAFQPSVYGGYAYFTTQAGVGGEGDQTFRGYAGGTSGHIYAIDPENGDIVWDFQTVEEDFWGNPEVNSGAGVWFPPAVDTDTGLTFWGTGNPAPFPGTFEFPNAASIEEPALYSNSLLALRYDTGELVWYNHVNPNDLFDLDFQLSPILAEVGIEGSTREIVIGSGKLGYVMAFDRSNGELLWSTAVGVHQNDDLEEIPPGEEVTVYPGVLGGVETPMAFAGETIYAPVLNLPTTHTATGWDAETGSEAVQNAESHTPIGQGTGELVAIHAPTGSIEWSHEFDSGVYGGATVVNDLVFTATFDGMVYALDRATGETVWSYQAPAGINAWPAVGDDTIVWPAGFGGTPVLFALKLSEEGVPAPVEATEPAEQAPTEEEPADGEAAAMTEEPEMAEEAPAAEATAAPDGQAPAEATEAQAAAQDGAQAQSEFVSVNEAEQTVTLTVIAAYDDTNGGLNFNGYANGEATFIVPQGWTVTVEFRNESDLPHSALVVPQDSVSQTQLPEPVFEGASTPDPLAGLTGSATFTFTAAEQGSYALACGVPGHAASGHWVNFEVGPSDAQPAFQTGS